MPSIASKSAETLVIRLLAQGAGVATGIVIARTLGPGDKGLFSYVTAVLALLLTVSSGQSAAVSYQYGRLKIASGTVLHALHRAMLVIAASLAIALVIASFALHQPLLLVVAAVFPFALFNQTALAFPLADGNVRMQNIQNLLLTATFFGAAFVALVVFHATLEILFACWIAVYAAIAVRSFCIARRYDGPTDNISTALRRQFVFGAKVTLNQFVATLNYQIDIFIIFAFLGAPALGVYTIAIGIGQMLWHLSQPLASSTFGLVCSGSFARAAELSATCVRHAFTLVGAAAVVLFFIGPPLITAIYGPRFTPAGEVLRWLLPGIIAYCSTPFFGTFFVQQVGKPGIMTLILSVSTLSCALVTIALIHRFGMVAGAIGTSVSYSISLAIAAVYFRRITNVPIHRLFILDRRDVGHYVSAFHGLIARVRALKGGAPVQEVP